MGGKHSQVFPLIEIHARLRQFPCGEHVEHLPNVRLSAVDELVYDVGWYLQFLPLSMIRY